MKIYIGHSRDFNYKKELYEPIRNSDRLREFEVILPHDNGAIGQHSREFYNDIDLFIAEVSYPSIGLGIELGWANDSNVPIICISRKGNKISSSLKTVSDNFLKYESADELVDKIYTAIGALIVGQGS